MTPSEASDRLTRVFRTIQQERMADVPELDLVIAPVGGGGLMSGTTLVAAERSVEAWAAEPAAVDDAARSMATGVRQPTVHGAQTVCDGLMTGLGELNFGILHGHRVSVVVVQEDDVLRAARDVLQRMKIVIEPSCATVLAALRARKGQVAGRRIGVILTGGNTDLAWMGRALEL